MRGVQAAVGFSLLACVLLATACGSGGAPNELDSVAVPVAAPTQPASSQDQRANDERPSTTVGGGIDFDGHISGESDSSIAQEVVSEVNEVPINFDTDAFPVVLGVDATTSDGMSWTFNVTLSSPYDTPQRYADAWRVLDRNDVELGIRVLGHDHASEQPFTRSQSGIIIAEDATVVFVEGRDQANGWSGQRFVFELPR